MRLAFLPDGRGGVDLGVRAENHTGRALAGLKLDANFPPNRMVTRTAWTLRSRTGTIGDLPAGKAAWGRIPTRIGADFPVENATYTAWVTAPDGTAHRMYDTCWLTVAPRLAGRIDGRLTEWQAVHPAWMYYTFSWARMGRHVGQLERHGEHFKYVYRTDARAAIYAGRDDRHLYLAVRCEDDDALFAGGQRDELEVRLNPECGASEASLVLHVRPEGQAVAVTDRAGRTLDDVRSAMTVAAVRGGPARATCWTVELAIPFSRIGPRAARGDGLGFDLLWRDADREGRTIVTGTWRWAGRGTSLGTMLLGK